MFAHRLLVLALALLPMAALAAPTRKPAEPTYYDLADFRRVPKVDAHVHLHGAATGFMRQAIHDNFRVLTINVEYPDFPPVLEQLASATSLRDRFPGRVAFAGTFSTATFGSAQWQQTAQREIDAAVASGAVAIKIWKNIGMSLKNPDGSYVLPDDPRLKPVLDHLEQRGIVLLGHQAEPRNCWLPLAEMTVRSDREYFSAHPQYYMVNHPEMPSHEALLAARDRMLESHPALKFVGVHLASLEWDVDEVARFLDRFPTARVDLSARLVHLEYQAARNPDRVRDFIIKYQDRILYGSDDAYGPADNDRAAVADVHRGWLEDWRFLVTSDAMTSADFDAPFQGLHLPRDVVDRIYRRNADTTFPRAWARFTPKGLSAK